MNRNIIRLLCFLWLVPIIAQEKPAPSELLEKLQAAKQERKKQTEAAMSALEGKLAPALALSVEELQMALRIKIQKTYSGAKLEADDESHTFLGAFEDEFGADSIFNDFGRYGSEFAANSIWNQFGRFGGQFAFGSPFNQFNMRPPIIVKDGKAIGRLTINKTIPGAVDPNSLKTYFKY